MYKENNNKYGKTKKVYLDVNENITQMITDTGVIVSYKEQEDLGYELTFNYILGKLISITKKNLKDKKAEKISLFRIFIQKFKLLREYNENERLKINNDKDLTARNLFLNFVIQ